MGVNAFHKFFLLLWKNWLLEIRHKWVLFFEFALPLLFCGLIVVIRANMPAEKIESPTIFQSFSPNLHNVPYRIAYAPDKTAVQSIINMSLERFTFDGDPIAFEDGEALLYNLTKEDKEDTIGIVFNDNFPANGSLPNDLNFSLRFPSRLQHCYGDWRTNQLFPDMEFDKPRQRKFTGGSPCYYDEGFLTLQNFISQSFVKLKSKNASIPELAMQIFPYPPYVDDTFLSIMPDMLPIFLLLCFVSPFGVLVKQITGEKEHQLKEVMKMMGLDNWLHWLAWFTKSMIFLLIISAVAVVLFKIPLTSDTHLMVFNYTDGSVLFFVMFIYSVVTTAFAIMLAVFFSKANTAQAVSKILFFITYIPFYTINSNYNTSPFGKKIGVSFMFNTAMALTMKLILKWEAGSVGLQWKNLFDPVTVDDNISVGTLLFMMLIDTLMYILIGLYVERIFPGEYGVPDPWYFPFTKRFWCGDPVDESGSLDVFQVPNAQNFEPGPDDKIPGIKIRNLRKVYGKSKVAVSGLSMDMYQDQITALLGHNGAGKTTTMSMLTGLFPPSSGTAIINGCDIRTNIKGVRASLGLCPQKNVIFDDLTVGEHLRFYCSLKGLDRSQTQQEISKYLELLDLSNKLNSLSSQLSGGMKRKLCVAIALCGSSKVVLLDEPTSGMDPAARRNLWNLLQEDKKGRTILLSTHFMDEADILGDRIAILSHGDLKACGSSFYLKKRFGVGYHLICEKKQRCNTYNVTKLLQKYIPDITVENNVGSELTYNLPEDSVAIFEQMLKDLEDNSENLDLSGYGISPTTLEEVFMRVEAEMIKDTKPDGYEAGSENRDTEALTLSDFQIDSSMLLKGVRHHGAQWAAMFTKKFYYTIRNWFMLLIHIVIPVGLLLLSALSTKSDSTIIQLRPLEVSLSPYGRSTTILQKTKGRDIMMNYEDEYEKMFKTFDADKSLEVINEDFSNYILKFGENHQPEVNKRYLVATSTNKTNIIAWFNNQAFHTPSLTMNLAYNALARTVDPSLSIEVTNQPLPYTSDYIKRKMEQTASVGFVISFNLGFGMCFVSTFFVLFAIKERISKAKLLQFVSGINIVTFWITSFLWDLIFFIGIISIITITFAALQADGYSTATEIGTVYLVLLLFAFAAIPITYLLSLLFNDSASGYGKIAVIYIFLGPAAFLLVFILDVVLYKEGDATLAWYFRIIPHFAMSNALNNLYMLSTVCSYNKIIISGCKAEIFSLKKPGIGGDLLFLFIDGVFYMIILLLIEFGVFNEFLYKIIRKFSRRTPGVSNEPIDDDVQAEKDVVKTMSVTEIKSKNLVLREVSKYYKNFLAVNKLSVAIQRAECFGLLGINGAGKTSTFKMLTGDESISSGDIYVKGIELKKNMSTVYKHIGYCPQFDALIEDLSGRETIKIFCLLRGVPSAKISGITTELAKSLGFYEHLDKRINEYSGGTKRKLSAALAMIGGPDIIYLDEPTTGMDPKSRRQLWDVICKIRDSGKTIVLTSHSMEECEALCTRLAIMVNGEFKCIGSRQHLKNKFSKGLILIIKVKKFNEVRTSRIIVYENGSGDVLSSKPTSKLVTRRSQEFADSTPSELANAVEKIKAFVSSNFPGAVIRDEYKELLTFFIPQTSIQWSHIFGLMQTYKHTLNVEDYSISQTTLEQIFLDFAKNQITKL